MREIVLSWSGGKDSSLALAELRRDANVEVKALITSITTEYDRISIHGVRRELLEMQAHLVCVDTEQIDASFAGRRFDHELLRDLPSTADPCGEKGEFHTFVSAGPVFQEPIEVVTGETVLRDNRFAYSDLIVPDHG